MIQQEQIHERKNQIKIMIDNEKSPKGSAIHAFFKGSFSGVVSSILLQPFDVVKTRMQGIEGRILNHAIESKPSMKNAVLEIYQADGAIGFWRGLTPTMLRSSLGPGLYFALLHVLQGAEKRAHKDYAGRVFLEGAFSRGLAGFLLCPLTVVKTRFEWKRGNQSTGIVRTLLQIVQEEKIVGLFRGTIPTLIRDIPSSGVYLVLYQSVFQPIILERNEGVLHPVANLLAASTAALVASVTTQPFDCIRTQLQLNNQNLFEGIKSIYKVRGWAGFFAGGTLRLIRRPLALGITWSIYEAIKVN